MVTQNNETMQLLTRLSTREERINMKYIRHLQDKISSNNDTNYYQTFDTYAPLLEVINLDKMYATLIYRCSKELYDRYKSKLDKNGSYHVDTTDRFEMIQNLFEHCSDKGEMTHLANSTEVSPYDCASSSDKIFVTSLLLIENLLDKIKLDDENKVLFYKDGDSFRAINNYTDSGFATFLALPLVGIINDDQMLAALKKFKDKASSEYKESDVIQFNDCYLEKGVCKPGFYPDGFPRFMIKRDVYQAYLTRKTTVHSEALDQLIMNLCNYDETTKERFLDVISTVFLNDSRFKKKYNFSPRIVGKDGGNGKSSFRTVIENAFRSIDTTSNDKSKGGNVCSFETKDLNNERIKYSVVNSLIAIDGDSSTSQISEDACAIFKQITSGDDVLIRPLYGESIGRTAITMMISFSNDFPASSDKSSAYLRRLEYIECEYQILDKEHECELGVNSKLQQFEVNDDWFDEIISDDAAQYLIEDMIIRARRIFETRKISPASEHMNKLRLAFAFSNNSSLAFLNEFEESLIVGFSVKEVKEKYREWCEENDLTVMKRKFNETLESKGLIRTKTSFKYLNTDASRFYECRETGCNINAWQFSDKAKNEEYFGKLHAENEYDYRVDKSARDGAVSRKIDEHLLSDEIKVVKLFITWMTSKNKTIVNRPTSDVSEHFESFVEELGCNKISRIAFNKIMESLGYRRKNMSMNRVDLTEEELSTDKYKNAKVINSWIKADTDE